MSLEALVGAWGYPVVFVGTVLEGEAVVIAAAFLAHQGLLDPLAVFLVAVAGSVLGDQFWYHVGRHRGRAVLRRHPEWSDRVERVLERIRRRPVLVTLGFRFVYGVRVVTPVAIGMSGFEPRRYALLNLAGAALWALVVCIAGYLFGAGVEAAFGRLHHFERWAIVLALVGAGLAWIAWRHLREGGRR